MVGRIRWAGALFLPEEARCVCLVRAADAAHAVLARDTAGLPTARVQAAQELSGGCADFGSRFSSDPR